VESSCFSINLGGADQGNVQRTMAKQIRALLERPSCGVQVPGQQFVAGQEFVC